MINQFQKELCKGIYRLGYKYDVSRVFCDFVECSAIAISNAVDPLHRAEREKRYIEIMKGYGELKERQEFCNMFATLTMALEENVIVGKELTDVLGEVFHELELHNKYKGQFFTPQNISDMMGIIAAGDYIEMIADKGYVTVSELACGSGAMVFGLANAMMKQKYNYCNQMVVTATDIDLKCVHMCYIQMALYGIPGVIIHGDTISMEEWSRWYTPVYLLDGWLWRQTCGNKSGRYVENEKLKMIFNPQYAAMRKIFGYGHHKDDRQPEPPKKDTGKRKRPSHKKAEPLKMSVTEGENRQLKFEF